MRLTDTTRAQNAKFARLLRDKQRGSSCLMLPVLSIREHVPALDAELLKFFILAASHGDNRGVAFAGVRHFWGLGYHPDQQSGLFKALEATGLIRYIRKGERDPITRQFSANVYQFNPALYFIRRRTRFEAMSLSNVPFNELPRRAGSESRIGGSPSFSDHNQLVKPTPESSGRKPLPESRARTTTTNHPFSYEGEKTSDPMAADVRSGDYDKRLDPNADSSESLSPKKKARANRQSRNGKASGANQNPTTPRSAAPPSPEQVANPLPDPDDEAVAARLKQIGTRLPQARSIVIQHGRDRVIPALEHLKAEMDKGGVKRPIGLLLSWLEKGTVGSDKPAQPEPVDPAGKRYIPEGHEQFEGFMQ